jgi:hypothetical protein
MHHFRAVLLCGTSESLCICNVITDCRKLKSMRFGWPPMGNVHAKFHENQSPGSKVERTHTHTHTHTHKTVVSLNILSYLRKGSMLKMMLLSYDPLFKGI